MLIALFSAVPAIVSKSPASIAVSITVKSELACCGHCLYNTEVAMVLAMPSREDTAFVWLETVNKPTLSCGHWCFSKKATLSPPLGCSPACHLTKPCHKERLALPLPRRANADNLCSGSCQPIRLFVARVNAAKPLADEANPAAVGTVL